MKNRKYVLPLAMFSLIGAAFLGAGCKKEALSQPVGESAKAQVPEKTPGTAPSKQPSQKTESLASPKEQSTPTAKVHMQEHLAQAERLRRGVEQGELETTRVAAAWLAEHELTPNLAEKWKPHVAMMRKAAHSARDAKDLETAAAAVGSMGEACASCHREIAGPKVEESSPPSGSELKAQMKLHAWAARQMWLGLMSPSDEVWVRGADALAKAELTPDELFPDRSPGEELMKLELEVQKLASEARSAQGTNAVEKPRGRIYGQLLATCSTCHSAATKAKSR